MQIFIHGDLLYCFKFLCGAPVDLTQWVICTEKWHCRFPHSRIQRWLWSRLCYMNVLEGRRNAYGSPGNLWRPVSWFSEVDDKIWQNPIDVADTIYKSIVNKTLTVDAFGSMTTSMELMIDKGSWICYRSRQYRSRTIIMGIPYTIAFINFMTLWTITSSGQRLHYPLAIVHADKNNNVTGVEFLVDTVAVIPSL